MTSPHTYPIPPVHRALICALVAAVLCSCSSETTFAQDRLAGEASEWIDNTGKHRVEAHFLGIEGNQVLLKRLDGKEIKIPFERLSKESVAQAKAMASASTSTSTKAPAKSKDSTKSSSAPFPDDLDAQAFVDYFMSEAANKNPTVVWDALPAPMQTEIEALVGQFAKRLDSRTFDMLRKTRNTVIEIAKSKQQFILNSQFIPIPPDQKPMLEESYPAIVGLIDSYVAKELFDSKRLQKGDLRGLVENWSKNVYASTEELGKTLPEGNPLRAQLMDYSGAQYSVEPISSNEAAVKLVTADPSGGEQETTIVLKKMEGRWLPKELVDGWESGIEQANAAVASLNGAQVHQQVSGFLLFLNVPLNNLKNASSQEDFDRTLGEIMALAGGMAGSAGGFQPPGVPPNGLPPGGFLPGGGPNGGK